MAIPCLRDWYHRLTTVLSPRHERKRRSNGTRPRTSLRQSAISWPVPIEPDDLHALPAYVQPSEMPPRRQFLAHKKKIGRSAIWSRAANASLDLVAEKLHDQEELQRRQRPVMMMPSGQALAGNLPHGSYAAMGDSKVNRGRVVRFHSTAWDFPSSVETLKRNTGRRLGQLQKVPRGYSPELSFRTREQLLEKTLPKQTLDNPPKQPQTMRQPLEQRSFQTPAQTLPEPTLEKPLTQPQTQEQSLGQSPEQTQEQSSEQPSEQSSKQTPEQSSEQTPEHPPKEQPVAETLTQTSDAARRASLTSADMLSTMLVANEGIDSRTAREVVQGVSFRLQNLPFAFVGVAALAYYGYEERRTSRLSLVCPAPLVAAIFARAESRGMPRFKGSWGRDSFSFRTDSGQVCRVRVRGIDGDVFTATRLSTGEHALAAVAGNDGAAGHDGYAKVMALPVMVNEYARLYVECFRRYGGHGADDIARDILWMLRRMATLVALPMSLSLSSSRGGGEFGQQQ